MGRIRETLVSFGRELGFRTKSYTIRGKRIVFQEIQFKDRRNLKVDILPALKEKPPKTIRNLPDHLPVCSEGCDTYIMFPEGEGGDLPCGKCGAEMKPKSEVY